MELWSLFQEQILGMRWLNEWLGRGLSVLGLDIHGRLGGSVQFFLYDSLKITVLLCVLIFLFPIYRAISHRSGASTFWAGSTAWAPIWCPPCWGR